MLKVYVCSPLSAPTKQEVDANVELARQLCLYAMLIDDVAAWAPHAFYTAFLDDGVVDERALGMRAGNAWLAAADALWVHSRHGVSHGMAREIEAAAQPNIVIDNSTNLYDFVKEQK